MSELSPNVDNHGSVGISDFDRNLSTLMEGGASSISVREYERLIQHLNKLQSECELQRTLKLKYQKDMARISAELQHMRKIVRRVKGVANRPRKRLGQKSNQSSLPDDAGNVSTIRLDKGLFLTVQQLRRDLKISEEDRQTLRQDAVALKKTIAKRDESIATLTHQLAALRKKVFGKSAERGKGKEIARRIAAKMAGRKKPQTAPKRREQAEELPVREVHSILEGKDRCCDTCGLEYSELKKSDVSDQLELKIEAYRNRLTRHKYKRSCQCETSPIFKRGPLPAKLFPASLYGDSIWEHLLVQKYHFQMPIQRITASLRATGLDLSLTTVNDGLFRFWKLFEPLEKYLASHSRKEHHWHCDETKWCVFEGKDTCRVNRSWYLWTILSKDVSMFYIKKSRGSEVVQNHFTNKAKGIISSDRFSVYRKYEKQGRFAVAYCWAHTRRDFIRVIDGNKKAEAWGSAWIKTIAALYHLANMRRRNLDNPELVGRFTIRIKRLLKYIEAKYEKELKRKSLKKVQHKTLERMKKHWIGLQVFVDHPELSMDNNAAERSLRTGVVGRKNYYGSGSEWSASFAALMFSILQTLKIWGINERLWFREAFAYIRESKADKLHELLPWNLSDEQKVRLRMQLALNSS